jgi:hypothetical protein
VATFRDVSTNNSAGASKVGLKPAGTQVGDVLYALVINDGGGTGVSVTPPSGWTIYASTDQSTPDGNDQWFYRKDAAVVGGDPASWTWTVSTGNAGVVVVAAWSGASVATSPVVAARPLTSSAEAPYTSSNTTPISGTTTSGITVPSGDSFGLFVLYDQTVQTDTWTSSGYSNSLVERADYANSDWVSVALASIDGAAAGATGAVTFTGTRASGSGQSGYATILFSIPSVFVGPTINTQPTNQSTNSGSTATFTASASNSGGAITYQWQDNRTGSFTNVASGGTSSSYTTPATDATYQGRSYRVVATDSNGSVTSGTAQLNVLGLPVYLWDTSVQVGNDVWLRNPLIAGSTTNKTATMAITLDGVAITAAATLGHTATMAPTLADITTAFSGTVGHSATSAFTLDGITFAASATVTGGASLTATMAFTLDGVTVASSATTGHIATMTATLDGVTITSAATAGHSATSAFTLGDISLAASATAGHSATSAITLDGITFAASATAVSGKSATLAIVLDDITVNSAVVSGHSATMAFTLDDVLVAMTATNSNAPPVTAVQDYFIEIRSFTDRRRI